MIFGRVPKPSGCQTIPTRVLAPRERHETMNHTVTAHVAKEDGRSPVVGVRRLRLPRRWMRRIFGGTDRVAVLLPGKSVDELHIVERDDLTDLAEAVGVMGGGAK